MIKFFRKIRQKMLTENKVGKYLIYAIGEIVLVVIGILIAIQVNNLNEQNKTVKIEIKILNELHRNLNLDLAEISEDLTLMADINNACLKIKEYLTTNNSPNDSLGLYASILRVSPHFSPNKSGYGLLQSKGIETISNDSLRNSISVLYEMLYPYYKTYEEERTRFQALHSEPVLLNYFIMDFNEDRKISYRGLYFDITKEDYQRLKADSKFLKIISAIEFENKAVQNRAKRIEQGIFSLIKEIKIELEI